jgi:hypothetical protein
MPRTICPLVKRGSYLSGSSGGRSSMVRRSIFPARLCEEGGELLEHGGDIVEHLYLLGIGTRAGLLAQPGCLLSVFLGVMHGEPIKKVWLRKFPRYLRSENDIDRFSSISHSARSAMSPIDIIVMTTRALSCLSPPAPSARQGDQSEAYRDHRRCNRVVEGPNLHSYLCNP